MKSNFERMIALAEETFDAHNDPEQLDVDEEIIKQLTTLHPAAVSEHIDGNGPVAWGLLIPTTTDLMNRFIAKEISEKELLNLTPLNIKYEAIYLCSGMVLTEYRRRGLMKQMALVAIKAIRQEHPVKALFTWNFSEEGSLLANSLAQHENLPLFKRQRNYLKQ